MTKTYSVTIWRTTTSKVLVDVEVDSRLTEDEVIAEVQCRCFDGVFDDGLRWVFVGDDSSSVEVEVHK